MKSQDMKYQKPLGQQVLKKFDTRCVFVINDVCVINSSGYVPADE